jgi:hypothetical protein
MSAGSSYGRLMNVIPTGNLPSTNPAGTAIAETKIAVVLMVGGAAPPTDRGTGFSSMSGAVLSIDLCTIASRRWSAIVFAMFSTSCSRASTYW